MWNEQPYWGELPDQPVGPAVEHPHATTVLLLGILSIFCCGALGPVAWVLGKQALNQIEQSDQLNHAYGATLGGRSQILVGYVLGIIGTVLMVLVAIVFLLMVLGGRA
ncbi:DUF4190 domain-containing protein [Nocardia sp. CA2R105]|uniref:DUF4190 domain-containing protein n=1 Tax=Nocardia jiangxiensis TaxID=282685 RepID=A0ABW6S9H7_9NOCA|nr:MULTISPECIES: DUF4190 domain-containing protein [Nocardia]MBY8855746.1 DUF4190 domain-containing protein [Nocardia coffeae]